MTEENKLDQVALENYPSNGQKHDLVYQWVKESTKGAIGLPLNVQIIGRPWHEEEVIISAQTTSCLTGDCRHRSRAD